MASRRDTGLDNYPRRRRTFSFAESTSNVDVIAASLTISNELPVSFRCDEIPTHRCSVPVEVAVASFDLFGDCKSRSFLQSSTSTSVRQFHVVQQDSRWESPPSPTTYHHQSSEDCKTAEDKNKSQESAWKIRQDPQPAVHSPIGDLCSSPWCPS
ncbi:uncharacterized protein J3R85_018692 [Psidium guajava]|nr:uncharacterized protein J3R85_018692 [Psidium guajava]